MPFDGVDVPTERTIELIQELGDLKVWYLTFSGGEPFLHPSMTEFIEVASSRGMPPTVNTNGLKLLEDNTLDSLLRLKAKGVGYLLSISLDSPDPSANDTGRGRGAEVVQAIHRGLSASLDIRIGSVVHAGTADTALDIIETFPGATNYSFFPMFQTWSTQRAEKDLVAEESVMQNFWERAIKKQEYYGRNLVTLPFRTSPKSQSATFVSDRKDMCFCGFSKCFIDSHLDLYPCDITRTPQYCLGNLATSSFQSVWEGDVAERTRLLAKDSRLCQRNPVLSSSEAPSIRYRS